MQKSYSFLLVMLSSLVLRKFCTSSFVGVLKKPSSLFKFGIISDTQYANINDDYNFQRTKMRRHRQSLEILRSAVTSFNLHDAAFNILLGDTLDGKCAGLSQQNEALIDILSIINKSNGKFHFAFGNHDYYCFNREQLLEKLSPLFLPNHNCNPGKLYYEFSPVKGWRFIMIDSYDVSLIGYSSELNLKEANRILSKHNPNDLTKSGGWFTDLPFKDYRYVPYNGGVSSTQIEWLDDVIKRAQLANERVICFSHQPVYAPYKPQSLI